jgi:large subunit ribosomal protein L35
LIPPARSGRTRGFHSGHGLSGMPNRFRAPFETKSRVLHDTETEMPKMKSKSGAKKRFSVTGSGRVKCKSAYSAHRLVTKRKSAKMRNRGTQILQEQDAKKVLDFWLPYAR